MKEFNYWEYRKDCPLAAKVEDMMNDCGGPASHLNKVEGAFDSPMQMFKFMIACVAYWSEAEYFDGRNELAVLFSKKIMEKFTDLKDMAEELDDDLLLNAFGFTTSAHRYLQNEFFKTILYRWEQNNDSVYLWLQKMEFTYNEDKSDIVPYAEVKAKTRMVIR